MAEHAPTTGIPVWVRVPGIIALILVAVVVGAMLLGATSAGRSGMTGDPADHKMGPHQPGPR